MALVFSGGTIVDTTFNLGTSSKQLALYQGIETALTAAGWTLTAGYPEARMDVDNSTTRKPNDADTVTILGKTYTFKTVINNGNDGEILIDTDGATTYANFIACLALGAGSGTKYSSATTAGDGVITEYALAGTANDYLIFTANSQSDAAGAVSESTSYLTWQQAQLSTESFVGVTAETPDYLIGAIRLIYNGESYDPYWYVMNRDRSASTIFADMSRFEYLDNADQRIIASKYGFWMFRPGSVDHASHFAFNVLSIPEPMRCKKITAATNASPIAITTNVAHGYTTGQQVKQAYVAGNTGANGTFTITVTGPTTYTCNGSVGTGAMTGSLGVVACVSGGYNEIFEFHHTDGSVKLATGQTFRWTFIQTGEHPGYFNGTEYDEETYWTSTVNTVVDDDDVIYPWFNGAAVLDAPIIAYSADQGATWKLAGQYYNIGILRESRPMDTAITDASGNDWVTLTNNYAKGTYAVLVP
jgi:hypothetical protein